MHLSEFIHEEVLNDGKAVLEFSLVDISDEEMVDELLSDTRIYIHKKIRTIYDKTNC